MSRLSLLILSLLAVGSILWVTLFGSSPSKPRRGARPAKDDVAVAPRRRPPRLRLAGTVLTADDAPLAGATVFVLPKNRPGLDRDKADHEVTDARGRWTLTTRTVVGCWIGVVAPGYRNAWLDGDGVDPSVQVFHVLERAQPIVVTLRDGEGRPLPEQGIQLEPWPPGASYFLPGPGARQGEHWNVTDERGRTIFRLGSPGPVLIRAHVEGHHTEPRTAWLADAVGAVDFEARRNTTLTVRLRDAASEADLAGLVTAEFLDVETGRPLFSRTETTQAPGRWRVERAVPAGAYHVRLEMDGRRSWLAPDVIVPPPPAELRIEAALEPAPEPATLDVTLSGNEGGRAPAGGRRRAPMTFLLRTDGDWARRGWVAGAPEAWNAAAQHLEFRLEPGRYQLLVADVLTGRAALEGELVLEPGAGETLTVAMLPGQRGKVPPMEGAVSDVIDLEVSAAGHKRLPVYGATADARVRTARTLDVIGRVLQGREVWLGPYPLDEFSLTLRRYGGRTVSRSFP